MRFRNFQICSTLGLGAWLISLFFGSPNSWTADRSGVMQRLSGEDQDSDQIKWDRLYKKTEAYVYGKDPALSLVGVLPKLPVGQALDLGMGEGRNAVYLAENKFHVVGVDISSEAIHKARRLAKEKGVQIRTVIADVTKYRIEPSTYDVILLYYLFLRRQNEDIVKKVIQGLKPCGILLFEANTEAQLQYNPQLDRDSLLKKEELKNMFQGLETLVFRETNEKKNAVAFLMAQKPNGSGLKCSRTKPKTSSLGDR